MGMALRDAYGESLSKYAVQNPNVVALDADLANCTKTCIMQAMIPERVFDVGIAENNMAAMAAGFAAAGMIPFINTFATLAASMCSLSAKALIGYSGLNVRIMGANNGLCGGYDGATHHAFDDLNVMRAIPGMIVLVPSTPVMMDWMVRDLIAYTGGPAYVSISRNAADEFYAPETTFAFGSSKQLTTGTDAAILACGLSVGRAMQAAAQLETEGLHVSVYDMFSIKPLDRAAAIQAARQTGAVVTVEEHSVIGGLGSAVLEVLAEEQIHACVHRVGIQDTYTESGSYAELLHEFALDAPAIAEAVRQVVRKKEEA